MSFLRIEQCTERISVVGRGFDMQMTTLRSCRLSLMPSEFSRFTAESFPTLRQVSLPPNHVPLCPGQDAFMAASAYTSAESLAAWSFNDTLVYVNSDRSSLLACQKVLTVP